MICGQLQIIRFFNFRHGVSKASSFFTRFVQSLPDHVKHQIDIFLFRMKFIMYDQGTFLHAPPRFGVSDHQIITSVQDIRQINDYLT